MAPSTAATDTLATGCCLCGKTEQLSRCVRCRVVYYCDREHQSAHFPAHKAACNAIRKAREKMEAEERALRNRPGDFWLEQNPFETAVGHFWGRVPTRDYMRARYGVVLALGKVHTRAAVETQLDHLLDMLRLCRGDNMGVRSEVPALMLRLGKDQDCYDFVKWWSIEAAKGDYDWGDMDAPFLNVKDADVFEAVDYLMSKYIDLSHVNSIMLLKVKMLLDIQHLQAAEAAHDQKLPRELHDNVKAHIPLSSIVRDNKTLIHRTDYADLERKLHRDAQKLYSTIQDNNKYFWPYLLQGEKYLGLWPSSFSNGSPEAAIMSVKHNYHAWAENPGALAYIRQTQDQ